MNIANRRVRMSLPFIRPENSDIRVSFEFFPPKNEKMADTLWASAAMLAPLDPSFVSVTYGAGGSTRARTHDVVLRMQNELRLKTAAHLTCVGATRGEIDEIAHNYKQAGITHIVAVRGDPPGDFGGRYVPPHDGYAYASDLVAGLKKIGGFEVSVGGYPEAHPESGGTEADIAFLKRKLDAGADRIITQFFIEPETFLRFRDRCAAAGITVPIVPGILPIINFERSAELARKCGAEMPVWMDSVFTGLSQEPETQQLVAATLAAEQCRVLYENGVRDFHFYTLNRAELTRAICHMMGVRGSGSLSKAA